MAEPGKRIRYHPLFDCDVIEAANWYDERSVGLGEAFTANVSAAVDAVIANPNRFGKTPLGVRYSRVKRFPYLVLFDVLEDELLFFGVLHTARSMEEWMRSRGI